MHIKIGMSCDLIGRTRVVNFCDCRSETGLGSKVRQGKEEMPFYNDCRRICFLPPTGRVSLTESVRGA